MKRIVLVMALALAPASLHADPQAQRFAYAIMRNGAQIGQHEMAITTQGESVTVDFRTQIKVKVMFVNAYSFGYAGREIWTQNSFASFQSKTNDNGAQHAVSATADGDKTVISADGKIVNGPGDVIPASFWNMAFLTRSNFFHTENGQLLKISVIDLGKEQLATRMGPRLGHHYRLMGGLERDLWFDQRGTPLRYQLKGSDNSLITSEALQ